MCTYFMAKADIKKESRIFYPLLPKHVSNTKSLKTHIKLIIPTRSNTCIIISIILCRPDRIAYAIQASCSRFLSMKPLLVGNIIPQYRWAREAHQCVQCGRATGLSVPFSFKASIKYYSLPAIYNSRLFKTFSSSLFPHRLQ